MNPGRIYTQQYACSTNEKYPPLKLCGMFPFYFTLTNYELNLCPYLSTEISGIQISELTKEGFE